jgi:hypothetical protein
MAAIEPKAKFGFVSLEGYVVGRLLIAALQKIPGEPTRQNLLDAIFGHSFDLGGVNLIYEANSNRGTHVVFMSMLHRDGSISVVPNLAP